MNLKKMSPVKMLVFGILLCVATFYDQASVAADSPQWTYYGIYGLTNWSYVSPLCNAQTHYRQSPISIIQVNAQYDATLTPISIMTNKAVNDRVILINNGHTVSFSYNQSAVRISGGHLNGSFRVGGVHFHWGSNDSVGSEHSIDNQRFIMEMHIVAYDETRYQGVVDASGGVNSLAVLSVLFTLSSVNNSAFAPVISGFKNVTIESNTTAIPYFDLSMLLPSNTALYFRYLGSLTTPPCSENVIWTVFKTTQTISSAQMGEFRKLHEMVEPDGKIDYLSDNWRPVEPLYSRIVQTSFPTTVATKASSDAVKASSVAIITALALVVLKVIATAAP